MQASIHATLYRMERTSERLAIGRTSTLRTQEGQPIDVAIEDLSVTGCRIATSLPLDVGDELMIGLAGVGVRACRIIWSNGDEIGCEFQAPLEPIDIEDTRLAQTLAHGQFGNSSLPPIESSKHEKKLSAGRRMLIIVAAAAGAWLLLCGVAALAYQLFTA